MMTNRELLACKVRAGLLTGIEGQRRHILRLHVQRQPCPNCGHTSNVMEASGVDLDAYDLTTAAPARGVCPGCKRELAFVVPMISAGGPGWHWSLIPLPPA